MNDVVQPLTNAFEQDGTLPNENPESFVVRTAPEKSYSERPFIISTIMLVGYKCLRLSYASVIQPFIAFFINPGGPDIYMYLNIFLPILASLFGFMIDRFKTMQQRCCFFFTLGASLMLIGIIIGFYFIIQTTYNATKGKSYLIYGVLSYIFVEVGGPLCHNSARSLIAQSLRNCIFEGNIIVGICTCFMSMLCLLILEYSTSSMQMNAVLFLFFVGVGLPLISIIASRLYNKSETFPTSDMPNLLNNMKHDKYIALAQWILALLSVASFNPNRSFWIQLTRTLLPECRPFPQIQFSDKIEQFWIGMRYWNVSLIFIYAFATLFLIIYFYFVKTFKRAFAASSFSFLTSTIVFLTFYIAGPKMNTDWIFDYNKYGIPTAAGPTVALLEFLPFTTTNDFQQFHMMADYFGVTQLATAIGQLLGRSQWYIGTYDSSSIYLCHNDDTKVYPFAYFVMNFCAGFSGTIFSIISAYVWREM